MSSFFGKNFPSPLYFCFLKPFKSVSTLSRFPVVCTEPFKQLAQLATHLEKLKPLIQSSLATFVKEEELPMVHDPTDFEMVKLEEDAILCDFNPWFRGLDWTSYRRFAPKSIPMNICQVIEQNKFTF